MLHRGEIIKAVIESSGVPKTKIADTLGWSRETLYNYLKKADLRFDIIEKIGKVIRHDFAQEFTDMPIVASEPDGPVYNINKIVSGQECLSKYAALWDKYTRLLEDYKDLTDKFRILEHKYK